MSKLKVLAVVAIAVAFSCVTISSLHATATIMKDNGKKACTDCHEKGKPSKDNLTEEGKTFKK